MTDGIVEIIEEDYPEDNFKEATYFEKVIYSVVNFLIAYLPSYFVIYLATNSYNFFDWPGIWKFLYIINLLFASGNSFFLAQKTVGKVLMLCAFHSLKFTNVIKLSIRVVRNSIIDAILGISLSYILLSLINWSLDISNWYLITQILIWIAIVGLTGWPAKKTLNILQYKPDVF